MAIINIFYFFSLGIDLRRQGFLEDFVFWGRIESDWGGGDLLCERTKQFFFGGSGQF